MQLSLISDRCFESISSVSCAAFSICVPSLLVHARLQIDSELAKRPLLHREDRILITLSISSQGWRLNDLLLFPVGSSTLCDVKSITSIFVCLLLSAMKFEVFTVVFSSVYVGSFCKPVHHVRYLVSTYVSHDFSLSAGVFKYVMNVVHSSFFWT